MLRLDTASQIFQQTEEIIFSRHKMLKECKKFNVVKIALVTSKFIAKFSARKLRLCGLLCLHFRHKSNKKGFYCSKFSWKDTRKGTSIFYLRD